MSGLGVSQPPTLSLAVSHLLAVKTLITDAAVVEATFRRVPIDRHSRFVTVSVV